MRLFSMAPVFVAVLLVTAGAAAANHGNHGGSSHSAAATNSNGVRSLDRDRGLERAADRRSSHSLTNKRSKKARARK